MRKLVLVLVVILSGCAPSALLVDDGGVYRAPVGEFSCGPFALPTQIQEAFGPNGGTVRFNDGIHSVRIDVEKLEPVIDKAVLSPMVEQLHQGYMEQSTLPLIRSGIADARLEFSELIVINDRDIFRSIVASPENTDGNGRTIQAIRALLQYTNGQYIYTITEFGRAWDEKSFDEQSAWALKRAERSFRRCSFP